MSVRDPVPLVRHFSPVPGSQSESDEREIRVALGLSSPKIWEDIDKGYRSVIVAEAGAGKTFEMRRRAQAVRQRGHYAFFIRIEDIDDSFDQAFEVGDAASFEQWLSSLDDAWFYLDSVDEARLDNPTAFEKAIRRFGNRIKPAQLRAHVCISSRPYAWRPKSDRELIRRHLPFPKRLTEEGGDSQEADLPEVQDVLEVLVLQPLHETAIRQFALHRGVQDATSLMSELERSDLLPLAGRPFDLEAILHKWASDGALGGRTELLQYNIEMRLKESHQPDRARRQPLNMAKAMDGARRLAAAVALTGEAGIRVRDGGHDRTGFDAETVLSDWEPVDVQALLERGIFDDVIYGAVRFRHRDVRELLVAEWFRDLLQRGQSRHAVESLFFRKQYGLQFASPRLRVVLPWLMLDDDQIRRRALALHPEIAVSGGDLARLPLPERERILIDIVERIVCGVGDRSVRDYAAIARIAHADLSEKTLALVDQHFEDDEAIFFLGRLVWQGAMSACVPALSRIGSDPARGIYARIAAVRAVATCGTDEQAAALWDGLLTSDEELPRELLAELIQAAKGNDATIARLLASLDKLPPYARFKVTGLTQALHDFVDRLPPPSNRSASRSFATLISGLEIYLHRPPAIESGLCDISQEYSWLLGPARHAIEQLVLLRADAAFDEPVLDVMRSSPTARHWRDEGMHDRQDELRDLVPAWPELNDELFWRSVRATRVRVEAEGREIIDAWQVQWPDHYWKFGPDSIQRILDWVRTRELRDDRLVALSLAFRLHVQMDDPSASLDELHDRVAGDAQLAVRLDALQKPPVDDGIREYERREAVHVQERELRQRVEAQQKSDWIARVRANPAFVRQPPKCQPGEMSRDQYWLMREVEGDGLGTERSQGAAWRSLIGTFGNEVAMAYRDAAMAHWRHYEAGLRSEGADGQSLPSTLEFAMVGLEIEAREVEEFPNHLTELEVRRALRFIAWELNGFPSWLEAVHRAWPEEVLNAVRTELFWELGNARPNEPMHYILHDVAFFAPWLHSSLAGPLLDWVRENDLRSEGTLRDVLHILRGGSLDSSALATIAKAKVSGDRNELHAHWYAVWVDSAPDTGVDAVANWLGEQSTEDASCAAQVFVTSLLGDGFRRDGVTNFGNFRTPEYLKSLLVLMHRHIPVSEDVDRSGGDAYSPGLRDHAQDARGRLVGLLSEIPGKPAYTALSELIEEHPRPTSRPWMATLARKRAEQDGDLQPWTATQVAEFGADLMRTPKTQRQLFDLAVSRVTDLKDWLEEGDDSPYRTWQRPENENEIRNLVAGWLRQNAGSRFTVVQEPEVANNQRTDIWLQNPKVPSPLPVELKLLDKQWTGPKLCERLRNQLVGGYLRERTGGYGLMLLVWQGSRPGRRWSIDKKQVGIDGMAEALRKYWVSISGAFPDVLDVEVVVIDLTVRE